ncbi:suppressor of fused domain protein [Botrimarina mediterranea]
MEFCYQLRLHYEQQWSNNATVRSWDHGPTGQLPPEFCVLEFPPSQTRSMWTYATCCMSQANDKNPIEIHLFSDVQANAHVELLTVIAHYHRTGKQLGLGHTVNFGRPWLPGSECDHGLLSLPYLDGPNLEFFETPQFTKTVCCLWLVPITAAEANYARCNGLEALEEKLEESRFNYLESQRPSVV